MPRVVVRPAQGRFDWSYFDFPFSIPANPCTRYGRIMAEPWPNANLLIVRDSNCDAQAAQYFNSLHYMESLIHSFLRN